MVYHPVLTDEQDQKVERLQAAALRCIYGYDLSYKRMRELGDVTTLRERRIKASDRFANKWFGNTRFSARFTARTTGRSGRSSRAGEQYAEDYARCNRLRDSPLFFMRRRVNGKEGKSYGERNKEYWILGPLSRRILIRINIDNLLTIVLLLLFFFFPFWSPVFFSLDLIVYVCLLLHQLKK